MRGAIPFPARRRSPRFRGVPIGDGGARDPFPAGTLVEPLRRFVEARIRAQDIDQVRVGQSARITLSGLNRQTTPDFPGRLIFVSPDLTSDQRTGQSYYRIKVQLDAAALAKAPQVVLKAGMPAEVFVETGNRSILSFMLKPMLDQIRYALRSDG